MRCRLARKWLYFPTPMEKRDLHYLKHNLAKSLWPLVVR